MVGYALGHNLHSFGCAYSLDISIEVDIILSIRILLISYLSYGQNSIRTHLVATCSS